MFYQRLGVLAFAVVAAACSTEYVFVPAGGAAGVTRGRNAASFPIPAAAPEGDLRMASNGIAQLSPEGTDEEIVSALHLRFVVSNTSARPWTLDTRAQRVEIAGRGASSPAFASASPSAGSGPPAVAVAPRSTRTIDLFFPLPGDMQETEDVPGFSVSWQVDAGGTAVAERTPFERVAADDAVDYGPYGYDPYWDYWGEPYPPYWYDPFFFGFYGVAFVRPIHVGHPYVIHGWRGHYMGHGGYYGGGGYHGYRGGGGFRGGHSGGHGGHR